MSTDAADAFPSVIVQGKSIDYDGIVLVQQFGGNLQIFTGETGDLNCLMWESGISETPSNETIFESRLFQNGRRGTLATVMNPSNDSEEIILIGQTDITGDQSAFYMIVDCDGTVGIYDSSDPATASLRWAETGDECGITAGPVCQRTVLMTEGDRVKSGVAGILQADGAFIGQRDDGNVFVQTGTPNQQGDVLWESCLATAPQEIYFTSLQEDSQFITRSAANVETHIWKRDGFEALQAIGQWELALECEGDKYGKLVIADSNSSTIAWEQDLGGDCNSSQTPVCSTAVLLLETDQRIWDGVEAIIETGSGYFLGQRPTGEIELWKGTPDNRFCMLWESYPLARLAGDAYTVMQSDGNLVTYWRQNMENFVPVWDSESAQSIGAASYNFVIDSCYEGDSQTKRSVAVYENNPITDADARKLAEWEFDDLCEPGRRDRALRGSGTSS